MAYPPDPLPGTISFCFLSFFYLTLTVHLLTKYNVQYLVEISLMIFLQYLMSLPTEFNTCNSIFLYHKSSILDNFILPFFFSFRQIFCPDGRELSESAMWVTDLISRLFLEPSMTRLKKKKEYVKLGLEVSKKEPINFSTFSILFYNFSFF